MAARLRTRSMTSPGSRFAFTSDRRRLTIAMRYALGAIVAGSAALGIGSKGLWLLWPAISLATVAGNYAVFGPAGFQKQPDGRMNAVAKALLAPYLLGAWINSRIWTRNDPAPATVRHGVMLGRIPSRREAIRFSTVIDLCAELPATTQRVEWYSFPMLDLVTPEPSSLRAAAAAIEEAKIRGPVLVCCALGYSRSVCALATWLLSSGHAQSAADAIEQIRRVRPRIVLSDNDKTAITKAVAREG